MPVFLIFIAEFDQLLCAHQIQKIYPSSHHVHMRSEADIRIFVACDEAACIPSYNKNTLGGKGAQHSSFVITV